jgi:hypothetical protein
MSKKIKKKLKSIKRVGIKKIKKKYLKNRNKYLYVSVVLKLVVVEKQNI